MSLKWLDVVRPVEVNSPPESAEVDGEPVGRWAVQDVVLPVVYLKMLAQ